MLGTVTVDTFSPHVGEAFAVELDEGGALEMTLATAVPWGTRPATGRQPFRLTFHGPREPVLPQRMYTFRHPALEELAIFIVPVGPDPATGAMRYEAVFS